jgi:catechol 2,3-dioxygenase-like lactoylglutathione lyase family enzyme
MFQKIILFLLAVAGTAAVIAQTNAKIEVVKYNHVALHVKDIKASTAFYKEIIRLEPIEVPDSLKPIRSWFKLGLDEQLHLLAGRTQDVINDRTGSHFAWFVKSIDNTEVYLKKNNIKYHAQVRFDGTKQIYVADPDGYLIEFNQVKSNY